MKLFSIFLSILAFAAPAGAVVITEIHYHPPLGEDALEFLELTNEYSTPEDVSGYYFTEGIAYVIPPGTIIEGRGVLVICADAEAVKNTYGIQNAIGNFTGRLDNGGERIVLANQAGMVIQSIRFRDRGKWPTGPDGTGHTLVLKNVYLDPGEPESWVHSPALGGSPGLPNFGDTGGGPPPMEERVIVAVGENWRYRKGNAEFSIPAEAWLQPGFNDNAWLQGASGFGYADGDDATELSDMLNVYTSVAIRKTFTLTSGDLGLAGEYFLSMDFDDGFCAYLNGQELARANFGAVGQVPIFSAAATGSREAGSETLYPISRAMLHEGANVLAIAGYNLSAGSSDFSLIPRVIQHVQPGGGPSVNDEPLVDRGASWKYVKGTAAFSGPASAWRQPGFSDAGWASGAAGFGFRRLGDAFIAYQIPDGLIGNQSYGGSLGLEFDANQSITVTRLGVFDSGSDGLQTTITARLFDRNSQEELASLVFSQASPGELIGGSRFKDLAVPVSLPAGFQGVISASGYGDAEPNGNQGSSPLGTSTDDGGGMISFTGGGRFGAAPDTFPDQADGGPADRYAAGTFVFRGVGGAGGNIVLPPGAQTLLGDMQNGYTSIATRKSFQASAEQLQSSSELVLAVDFDDGFCAFLNGAEIARINCGAPGSEPVFNGVASAAHESGTEQFFNISKDLLVEGANVLAIAGFNAAADNPDFQLHARLFLRHIPTGGGGGATVVFNELFRSFPPGDGWAEIYNAGPGVADLSGMSVVQDPDLPAAPYRIPADTRLQPKTFLVLQENNTGLILSSAEVHLFLLDADGLVAAATTFDRVPPAGLAAGTFSECRFPDGGELDWITNLTTPGAANRVPPIPPVVINEILYNPPDKRPGEFLELYNRGAGAVDLSGFAIERGVDYTFSPGTSLAAGGYLVIAKDPAYLQQTYGITALGPFEGQLADGGESIRLADRWGNPVDSVRYFDGGAWSRWADGGGSSLELIDPDQDNTFASAWDASDETGKAQWTQFSFNVPSYQAGTESELHLYLVEPGECQVDDVSIQRAGNPANLIGNPGFEANTTGWIIGGTHIRSQRTTAASHTGNACLQVVASGKGDTTVNRIETETSPALVTGASYDVSIWARWQRGSSLMVIHGVYTTGPFRTTPCFTCGVAEPNLSGNPLSAPLRLDIPLRLGTPGAENSARIRLRAATGGNNLGPVIAGAINSPPSPEPDLPVTVTARIADSGGVASAEVFFRTGSAAGAFQSVPLADDGAHGDGVAGDGTYGCLLPGFPNLSRVVYYIEASDNQGATQRYPLDAPAHTCLFAVRGSTNDRLDAYRLILDSARTTELQSRQLHSNDLVDGAFILNNQNIFYNVGARYRGSPWGRPSLASMRVRFPEDNLFNGTRRDVNISKTGVNLNEGVAMFLIGRNAAPGRPSPSTTTRWIKFWFNEGAQGNKADIEAVDRKFLEKWYPEDSDGPLLKAFGRFVFNDGGGLSGQQGWEGASFIYRNNNSENYRGYFVQSAEQSEDNWEPLFTLTRTLSSAQTPDALYDQQIESVLDWDRFLRVFGARVLVSDCDFFGINNGHNGYIVYDSVNALWGYIAFDVECSWGSSSPSLFQSADPSITRLFTHPRSRRAYMRILNEFANGYWSSPIATPYLDALQRATGFSAAGYKSFIAASSNSVKTTLQSFTTAPFRITTNSGNDISTAQPTIQLEGDASVQAELLQFQRGEGDLEPFNPTWTTPSHWRATFDIPEITNSFAFFGSDADGNMIGTDTITITNNSGAPNLKVTAVFPTSGPAEGGTLVTISGTGFQTGLKVFFGGVEGLQTAVVTDSLLTVRTPPVPTPIPPGGKVDIRLQIGTRAAVRKDGFTYTLLGLFRRGDANADGGIDLADAVKILIHLFRQNTPLPCERSADSDDSGAIEINDAVVILNYLFLDGLIPAPATCGTDPTPDALDCDSFPPCS